MLINRAGVVLKVVVQMDSTPNLEVSNSSNTVSACDQKTKDLLKLVYEPVPEDDINGSDAKFIDWDYTPEPAEVECVTVASEGDGSGQKKTGVTGVTGTWMRRYLERKMESASGGDSDLTKKKIAWTELGKGFE